MMYSIKEVFDMLGEANLSISTVSKSSRESIEVDGFKVYTKSLRYATFYQKGCDCVSCGRKGAYFKLDAPDPIETLQTSRRHFNLYSEDGILITKDHILPKRWGGKDHIDNMQPMCSICNKAKGSACDLEIDGITATDIQNPELIKRYTSFEECVAKFFDRKHITSTQKIKRSSLVKSAVEVTLSIQEALKSGKPYMNHIFKYETFNMNQGSINGGE